MRLRLSLVFLLLGNIMNSVRQPDVEPSHTQNLQETSLEAGTMSAEGSHRRSRLTWTEKMCVDLMLCKEKAEELHQSENCPRKDNGRKEGKMNLTLNFWNDMGYEHLKRTAQNLRDKLAHIEKTTRVSSTHILEEIVQQQQARNIRSGDENDISETPVEAEPTNLNHANHPTSTNGTTNNTFVNQDLEYANLHQKALEIYNKVITTPGDWNCREEHTFTKKHPNKTQVDKLQHIAKNLIQTSPIENPSLFLWECNCAIYATATSFKFITKENKKPKQSQSEERNEKPIWLIRLEQKTVILRKQTSQITEEIRRVQSNKKMTRKLNKNRRWIKKELNGRINLRRLVTLKEKKINTLRKLKNAKKTKLETAKTRKANHSFDQDQGKFFGHLRAILDQDKDTEKPKYIEKARPSSDHQEENTLTKEDFEAFWIPIWQNIQAENLTSKWIAEVRKALKENSPEQEDHTITVTEETVYKGLKKKKNWSAPGLDRITNFWLKCFNTLHAPLADAITKLINSEPNVFPEWLAEGRTVMLPKKNNPTAQDFRPITCLNTLYKLITSVVNMEIQKHESRYHQMQIDQRGGAKGSMGCIDNLLIDKAILEDATKNAKNISCVWIDVKKAFDSVSHDWLLTVLNDHGINKRLVTFIHRIVKSWKTTLFVPTVEGKKSIGPIRIDRGILQGDSFCVKLFTLCLNPIAWYLRSTEGYTFTHDKSIKITHCLFVDDLKSYHKNAVKAATVATNLENMFKDIGLLWGINKCAAIHIKRGKLQTGQSAGLPLGSGKEIALLGEGDYYKFLGKFENVTQLEKEVQKAASKEYIRRLSVIWSTPLSITRKIKATNIFAVPVLLYHMWTTDWSISDLKELDRKTRQVMNENKGKHKHESNPLLYLPFSKGGKGMQELETLYKVTKIKTAHYLTASEDPHLEIVSSFQSYKERKSLRSIIKDAKVFASHLNIDIKFDNVERKTTLKSCSSVVEVCKCQPRHIKTMLKKEVERKYQEEVKQQPWVGQYVTNQWQDKDLHHESYNILNIWKNIPNVVYSVHTGIVQQLISTKVYEVKKLKGEQRDLNCRFCHTKEENIPHILCSCPAIAQTLYKSRHDRMLRPIYHEILKMVGLHQDKESTPWYKELQPKSCVENENAKILWDIPIHQDIAPRNGANKPDILLQNKNEKQWIIIEGTVCNIGQINERDRMKTEKYTDLRSSLKRLYPDHEIIQINIVFDFLSGFHKDLVSKLHRVGLSNVLHLIRKCQRWIISQNCEIIKALYTA